MKIADIKEKLESEFNKMFVHKAYVEFYFDSQHRECRLKPLERIPLVLRIKSLQQSFILNKVDHYLNGKPVYKLIYGYPLSVQSSFCQITKETTLEILNIENEKIEQTLIKVKNVLMNTVDNTVILEIDNIIKKNPKPKKNKTNKETTNNKKSEIEKSNITIETHILEKRDMEKNSSFELDTWLQTSYNNVLLKKKFLDLQIIIIFAMCIVSTILLTWLVADNYFEAHYKAKYKSSILIISILSIILKGVFYL